MKTINKFLVIAMVFLTIGITVVACSSSKKTLNETNAPAVADVEEEFKLEKSGAQFWGETCNRCHLAPSPADYNDTDWETISLHMKVRANLTENEITKIKEFLKSAN
jgi:cytochrome c5